MTKPNNNGKQYVPDQLGTQSRGIQGNKGKKMMDKSGKHAQVIQTKGE